MNLKAILICMIVLILFSCNTDFKILKPDIELQNKSNVVLTRFDIDINIDFWNPSLSYVFLTHLITNSNTNIGLHPYKFNIYLDQLDTVISGNLINSKIEINDSITNVFEIISTSFSGDSVFKDLKKMNTIWEISSNPQIEFEFKFKQDIIKTNKVDLIFNKSNFKTFLIRLRMGELTFQEFINYIKGSI